MVCYRTIREISRFGLSVLILLTLTLGYGASALAAAGRTPGTFSVSSTGDANYSIPIWAPRGPRGMQPALALYYDSRSSVGTLGLGWSIAGLGAITRCPKTVAQDTVAAPVALATSDGYCLNGNRLRLTSAASTYGASGSTYLAETTDFSQITAEGTAGNGPAYFTVQTPNGLTYEYGFIDANNNGANSQVVANGTALTWLLSKVIDRAGNNYVINYTTLGGAVIGTAVPSQILWTPTASGASTYTYTMQFNYSSNVPQSSTDKYIGGAHVANPELLTSIEILASGAVVKDYFLGYQSSSVTGREQLTTVTECADLAESNCLSPTTVTYGRGTAGVSTTATTSLSATGSHLTARYDLNGDGYPDIVYEAPNSSAWYASFGSASGYSSPVNIGINANVNGDVLIGRLTGGAQDGVLANNNGTWYYYSWNGAEFAGVSTGIAFDTSTSNYGYQLADINGDGLPDLVELIVTAKKVGAIATISTRLNTSSGGSVSFSSTATTGYTSGDVASAQLVIPDFQYSKLRHYDFNGDGQDDLVLMTVTGSATAGYSLNTDELISTGSTFSSSQIASTGASTYVPVFFTNWNDDACTDFVTGNVLYVSGCNGTAATTFPISGTVLGAMDWDGDGRTDLLVANGSTIGVYLSTGSGISALNSTSIPYSSNCAYVTMDAAGGGLDDLGCWNANSTSSNGSVTYYLHNGVPDLATQFQDGYGNYAAPSYVVLTQAQNSVYFPRTQSYPNQQYLGPLYLVNSVTFNDPSSGTGTGTYTQSHYYSGATVNLSGRGFVGMQAHQMYDSRSGIWETWDYDVVFPNIGMLAQDVQTLNNTAADTVFSRVLALSDSTVSNTVNEEVYFPYVTNDLVKNYEVGGPKNFQLIKTTSTNYTFDSYGNPTTIATTVTDNDSGSPYSGDSWTTTTTNIPDVDTTHWCLNLYTQTQVAYTASIGSAVTRTKQFVPDTTNCRYTQIVTEPNSSQYKVTENLAYDGFGNLSSDAVTGVGMAARTTSITWSNSTYTTGQFPLSVTDASGATTQVAYNYSFGVPSSRTDANALPTSWGYDGFGREVLESRPDRTSTSKTYNACAPPNTCDPLWRSFVFTYALDTQGNTINQSVRVYDALDRQLEVSTQGLNGSYATVLTTYDNLGRVASKTEPFLYGATQYVITDSYDVLNRLTQSQGPINSSNPSSQTLQSYQYQGDTTILTDANGHTRTLVNDAKGWQRQTTDATGYTVSLAYDAAGSKNSVTDSLGNPLWAGSYQYGIAPFLLGMTDTDLGTWSFTVDPLGERTAWRDAKGQSFSMLYDALSRPTDRYEPDLYTHWSWGTNASADNIGQLSSVCTGTGTNPTTCTASPGYAESETYDSLARWTQRSIQIPGDTTYTYAWAYNATTGLPQTLTYPTVASGSALQIQYGYQNGLLESITDVSPGAPNVTLWTANAGTARGQYTQETLGNGVVVNHSFDAVTGWVNSITAGVGGSTALQNNSYLFDAVGNLIQRQDNNAGVTENAYPDSLNRLSSTVGDTNTQLTYDTMGRLATLAVYGGTVNVNDYATQQTGCSYYANAQAHAVRKGTQGTEVQSYCYDQNGNMTESMYQGAVTNTQTWTSFNQPNLITGGSPTISSATSTSQFFYDQNHQRWKQVASYSGSPETTEYIGGLLEKMQNATATVYRYYVPAGNNTIVYNRSSTGTTVPYYLTRDHLGSTAVITDPTGALVVSEKYAALGWNENTSVQQATMATVTRHEFTGQEGLDNPGIWMVNMNGRVYVPSGLMFLSPDPHVPDPTNTLSYNRYAYVNYNPLSYIDPSGYCPEYDEDGNFTGDDGSLCEITVEGTPPAPVDFPPLSLSLSPPPPIPIPPPALGGGSSAPPSAPQGNQDIPEVTVTATPCPTHSSSYTWSNYFSNVAQNFMDTHTNLQGLVTPTGLGIHLSAATSEAWLGTPAATAGRWIFTGFPSIQVGSATFTTLESGILVGASSVLNFSLTTTAWVTGVAGGSVVSAIPTGSGNTVSSSLTNFLLNNFGPSSSASELACGW